MAPIQLPQDNRYLPDVILEGHFGAGNLSDDINMVVSYRLLSEVFSGESICVSTVGYSPYVKKMLGGARCIVRNSLVPPSVRLSFVGGGGPFFDFGESSPGFGEKNLCGSGHKAVREFDTGGMEIKAPRNIAFGLGLGPFISGSPIEKKVSKYLAIFDLITVRDEASRMLCEKWGYVDNVLVCADSAFLFDAWAPPELWPPRQYKPYSGAIGIVVRDWAGSVNGHTYLDSIITTVKQLRRRGYLAQYVSLHPEFDSHTLQALEGEELLCWDPRRMTLNEFLDAFDKFSLVISARSHGAILASCLGIPSISIAIEPRPRRAHEMLPLANELWLPPFVPDALLSLITESEKNYERTLCQLEQYALSYRSNVKETASQVVNKIRELASDDAPNRRPMRLSRGVSGWKSLNHYAEQVRACKSACNTFAKVARRQSTIQLSLLTWNSLDVSPASLKAIIREASYLKLAGQRVNICVCDNGSTDGTVNKLKDISESSKINVQFICNPTNRGSSLARNQIIDHAIDHDTDYLLFVDSDIEMVPFSSVAMVSYLHASASNVGAIGLPMGEAYYTVYKEHVAKWLPNLKDLRVQKTWSAAPTHYGLFRTQIFGDGIRFEEKGPFSGPGWGFEDNDLAFQMFVSGWEIHTVYGAIYMHSTAHSTIHALSDSGINPENNYGERKDFFIKKWTENPLLKGDLLNSAKSWKGEHRFMLQGIY
jgi:glycosyltransferase involved in cell wall biosynthesis